MTIVFICVRPCGLHENVLTGVAHPVHGAGLEFNREGAEGLANPRRPIERHFGVGRDPH